MMDGEPLDPAEAFFLPGDTEGGGELDPRAIARKLVDEDADFADLRHGEASILFVMRADPFIKAGKAQLGSMSLTRFQGSLGPFAEWMLVKMCGGMRPDYIMTLDAGFWRQATPLQRTALIDHELRHACQKKTRDGEPMFDADGLPVWDIVGHDIEEFNATVAKYGAWLPDVTRFIEAYHRHG